MRIGGDVLKPYQNPQEWYEHVKDLGYRAVNSPINYQASKETRQDYLACIKEHDLVLGEVGVWRNCLAADEKERAEALTYAKEQLALAEELGANCCVNISGSRGVIWDGFDIENYSRDTYAMIVDTTREIIDAVKPKQTFYSIEPMPWMVPDSPKEYLQLIKDIDRKAFAVHLDFVNMINCPKRYVFHEQFIADCFHKLGPYIKSIHGKDVLMENKYTTIIKERMPGKGIIDYKKIAVLVDSLGKDTPIFVEHLPDYETYKEAAAFVKEQAELAGVDV